MCKVCCTCKVVVLVIKPIGFFAVLIAVAVVVAYAATTGTKRKAGIVFLAICSVLKSISRFEVWLCIMK